MLSTVHSGLFSMKSLQVKSGPRMNWTGHGKTGVQVEIAKPCNIDRDPLSVGVRRKADALLFCALESDQDLAVIRCFTTRQFFQRSRRKARRKQQYSDN
jgi:hypothetical protein